MPRRITRVGAFGFAMAIGLGAGTICDPAWAQSETAEGAAEALFRQAVGLAKQGEYEQAIAKFRASYEIDPARGTLLGWAMAEERAGKLASALAHFQQLRDLARLAGDERREQLATRRIVELLPRVPTLTITAAEPLPEGTALTLNGRALPRGALDSQLPLESGDYELLAEAPDGARFVKTFSLEEGARESVQVVLTGGKPERPPAPPPEPPPSVPDARPASGWTALRSTGFVLGVAGVAGLGAGTYFWMKSGSTYDQVNAACPNGVCPPEQQAAIDDGRTQEQVGRVALILGGVLMTTGVTLFVLGARPDHPQQHALSVAVTPQSVGVGGRF